jgi:hypothetical protein
MKMTYGNLSNWIRKLAVTKPYRILLKNGHGFYEVEFLCNEWHHSDKIYPTDMEDEIKCQKKVLGMCMEFEKNIRIPRF